MDSLLRLRSLVSAAITVLVVTQSVAVTLLDRAGPGSDPGIENEHQSSCPPSHDHTVCAQFGANLPLASAHTRSPTAAVVRATMLPDACRVGHGAASVEANRSRAPPSV